MEQALFYILAAVAVVATVFSISERHAVHAIMYLVISFFALAVIFYLLGAPLVAAFEVIIYAGAIMVLFLFIIMMLDLGHPETVQSPSLRTWLPALLLAGIILASIATLALDAPATASPRSISIREFSTTLFRRYGIAVEIVSLQLLFALVGALYYGRQRAGGRRDDLGEAGSPSEKKEGAGS